MVAHRAPHDARDRGAGARVVARCVPNRAFAVAAAMGAALLCGALPARAQTFTCGDQHLGTDDGCDCGCGAPDPDCGAVPVDVRACEFDGCGPGLVPSAADPTTCAASVCGDGYLGDAEAGDDGDSVDGGGCNAACDNVEPGWLCGAHAQGCRRERGGDGQRTASERCDDGNQAAGDGCAPDCTDEPGFICYVGQPCRRTVCGDLFAEYDLTTGTGETCDDGNQTAGDGCFTCEAEPGYYCDLWGGLCQVMVCGDGAVEGEPYYGLGEACDDGNDNPDDGCDRCAAAPGAICWNGPCHLVDCGDGIIDNDGFSAFEQCDDGNDASDDGCSATCTLEPGFDCYSAPPGAPCIEVRCGDGIISYDQFGIAEACDDGNEQSGDGCDASCSFVEDGFLCDAPGEPCRQPVCGDGFADRDTVFGLVYEQCDDGNTAGGDGCSPSCTLEDGFECLQEGELCTELPPGWQCSVAFFGTGDGCDCGCGSRDPDCSGDAVAACTFNHCFDEPRVAPDPCQPSRCVTEDEAAAARCPLDGAAIDDGGGPSRPLGCCALTAGTVLDGAAPLLLALMVRLRRRTRDR